MKNKLYFDIDGVLRMLADEVFGEPPKMWDQKIHGKTLIDIVNEDPTLCLSAPPSEYLPIVNNLCDEITIITNQLPSWKPWTEKWLKKYMKIPYEVIYTNGPDEKLKYLDEGSLLVDDSPKFSSYKNIALVSRPYNNFLEVPLRVNNQDDLKKLILSGN